MKAIELFALGLFIFVLVIVYKLHRIDSRISHEKAQLDSLNQAYNDKFKLYDSLTKIEPLIIERHQHNTNKYYENHYTIIAANDSATKSSLFGNLARYEYLHNSAPSQNNKPNH